MGNYIFDLIQNIIYNQVKQEKTEKSGDILMPVITINNYCEYVQMAGVLQVVLPASLVEGKAARLPTLFLLAPEGEEGSRWLRHTQAELLADKYQVAMVLVSCLEGCYTDMAYGYQFFQSLEKGVPDYLHKNVPALNLDDGQCYVAGCSMGGMGAIKLALQHPERFISVGSFSGRLDNKDSFQNPVEGDWLTQKRMINLWGSPEAIQGTVDDLTALKDKAVQASKALPAFYVSAGTGDIGYASSKAFVKQNGHDFCFVEREGRQDWFSWSDELHCFLKWAIRKGGK